jgi:YVTN family beta-propeller protein
VTVITLGVDTSMPVVVNSDHIYVASGGTVKVLDPITKQVTATIPGVGFGPMALSPDGTRLYAADQQGWSVSTVDTSTNEVIDTMYFSPNDWYYNGVWDLTVGPDGNTLYVALGDATVAKIDVTDDHNTVTSVTDANFWDGDMELSPDGSILYGTDGGIIAIHTATMTSSYPADYIPVPSDRYWIEELAVSPDGKRLYVVTPDTPLLVYDIDPTHTTYNTAIASIGISGAARDVALSPDGTRAYVTGYDGKTITVVDTVTNTVVGTFTTDETGSSSGYEQFITVGPDGTLYVTDVMDGKVYVVTVGNAQSV